MEEWQWTRSLTDSTVNLTENDRLSFSSSGLPDGDRLSATERHGIRTNNMDTEVLVTDLGQGENNNNTQAAGLLFRILVTSTGGISFKYFFPTWEIGSPAYSHSGN